MNRVDTMKSFAAELVKNGIEEHEAQIEARFSLSFVLDCEISSLYTAGNAQVSEQDAYRLSRILARRTKGEPLEYILGEKWFMGLKFKVTPDVLIPRRETELLCENAIQLMKMHISATALDLCTGSGCIAVSLARFTRAKITAADISLEALAVARENAKRLGCAVDFRASDMFSNIPERFDIICSNPPYIPSDEIHLLMREVRDYEPRLALDAGYDGLRYYRKIAKEAPAHLNENGLLALEIGCEQGRAVAELLEEAGFADICVLKDYSQLDRVVTARIKTV